MALTYDVFKPGPYVDISACGGVVEAAISDGGSSLQVALSSAQSILINYLDPKTPPNVALAELFTQVSVSPIKKATAAAVSFKGCTQALATQQTVAPSVPAPVPTPTPSSTAPAPPPTSPAAPKAQAN